MGAYTLAGIPAGQQPRDVRPNRDRPGKTLPGRQYEYEVPATGGGTKRVVIRDDAAGHNWGPSDPQNRGSHFNNPSGGHYDY